MDGIGYVDEDIAIEAAEEDVIHVLAVRWDVPVDAIIHLNGQEVRALVQELSDAEAKSIIPADGIRSRRFAVDPESGGLPRAPELDKDGFGEPCGGDLKLAAIPANCPAMLGKTVEVR